jgi:hypothetical protein
MYCGPFTRPRGELAAGSERASLSPHLLLRCPYAAGVMRRRATVLSTWPVRTRAAASPMGSGSKPVRGSSPTVVDPDLDGGIMDV